MITILIDMDGVLTKDKNFTPFEHATDFIKFLKAEKIPFKIVSNNSTRPPYELITALKEKGFKIDEKDLITPVAILPDYLRNHNFKTLFVIGTEMLASYLEKKGFDISKDYHVDAVVIGQDKKIDFDKIKTATSAVFLKGASIVPVNLSKIVKDSDGLYFPGAGSIAKMIAEAVRYSDSLPNLGKPSPEFIKIAMKGIPSDEVYLVSDDIYTDLIGASDLGIKTVFMTTGKYGITELEKVDFKPDFVFGNLEELKSKIFEWLNS